MRVQEQIQWVKQLTTTVLDISIMKINKVIKYKRGRVEAYD